MSAVLAPPGLEAPSVDLSDPDTLARVQQQFTAALPKINKVLRFRLRGLPEEVKDDLVAEATALSWQTYRSIVSKGRDPAPLVNKIAQFAAMHAYRGGRLAGKEPVRDAMSRGTGRWVQSIEARDDGTSSVEVLRGMSASAPSPAEQAAFNIDFADWLDSHDGRHKAVAEQLATGLTNAQVGQFHGVGRGRISQLRGDLREDWESFTGEGRGR